MRKQVVVLIAVALVLTLAIGCSQQQTSGSASTTNAPAESNKALIDQLNAKVDEVAKKADAAAKKAEDVFKVQPKFAIPMREYGQRFADMYYAAKNGNWALAAYMLKYMKAAMNPASITKPEEYKTLQAWEQSNLKGIVSAIEKKDFAALNKATQEVIASCNSCHAAMGYDYVDYKLPPQPFDQHLDYNLKTEPTDFKEFDALKK